MIRNAPVLDLSMLLLALWLLSPFAVSASDFAKEARWADQIVDELLDGEPLWLDDGNGHEFLGIITEGDSESGRAVILVHGSGVHPNWPDVIYPLRVGLLESDITTLSIQMPILPNEAESIEYAALFPEVPARFESAFAYLEKHGFSEITIVAHSLGASMTVYYLSQQHPVSPNSVVLIGLGEEESYPGSTKALARLQVAALDMYGSEDLEQVLASADRRNASGRKSGFVYRQLRVEGANHFFQGNEDELVARVQQWLDEQSDRAQ